MDDCKSVNSVSGRRDPVLIVTIFGFNVSCFDEFGALAWRGCWGVSCCPLHSPVLHTRFCSYKSATHELLLVFRYFLELQCQDSREKWMLSFRSLYQVFCWCLAFVVVSASVVENSIV